MAHQSEYHDAMVDLLELIWGDGFMAPGGEGNVAKLIGDLDIRDQRVLDIGCGLGGPACVLASQYGARVVGVDLEAALIERARRRATALGLQAQTEFKTVNPGPMDFPDQAFDVVMSSGAFTQTPNKPETFAECLRVLRPGGTLTCYEWMKNEGDYSDDMRYFFKMEGLTYAMETLARYGEILREVGFGDIQLCDASDWYRREVRREYEQLGSWLYPRAVELIGQQDADHFVENWRAMMIVCDKGEMRQGYCRARKAT
jgi:phosphoethanolamine N-methyltransferase